MAELLTLRQLYTMDTHFIVSCACVGLWVGEGLQNEPGCHVNAHSEAGAQFLTCAAQLGLLICFHIAGSPKNHVSR